MAGAKSVLRAWSGVRKNSCGNSTGSKFLLPRSYISPGVNSRTSTPTIGHRCGSPDLSSGTQHASDGSPAETFLSRIFDSMYLVIHITPIDLTGTAVDGVDVVFFGHLSYGWEIPRQGWVVVGIPRVLNFINNNRKSCESMRTH